MSGFFILGHLVAGVAGLQLYTLDPGYWFVGYGISLALCGFVLAMPFRGLGSLPLESAQKIGAAVSSPGSRPSFPQPARLGPVGRTILLTTAFLVISERFLELATANHLASLGNTPDLVRILGWVTTISSASTPPGDGTSLRSDRGPLGVPLRPDGVTLRIPSTCVWFSPTTFDTDP